MADQEGTRPARFLFEIPDESDLEFRVVSFNATEGISSPYRVALNLASEDEAAFDTVIGKAGFLTILSEDTDRFFHGIVSEFTQAGRSGRFNLYKLNLVPSIWLLSLENDCRIFQEKTVPEIVQQILEEREITSDNFAFRLQKEYDPRTYCVQYRESDLNFISRLLEEEGIFYFFEHEEDKHLLVFGDGTVNYQPIGGEAEVEFHHEDLMVPSEEFVSSFVLSRRIRSGKFSHTDFNYEQPSVNLMSEEVSDTFEMLEIYDYPGEYREQNRGKRLAIIRLEEVLMLMDRAAGKGSCARFVPGFTFTLTDHDNEGLNQEYLLINIMHLGSQAQALEEQRAQEGIQYSNEFVAIPSSVVFRPKRNTPKPVVEGIHTAIISGPKGEEIYTDKYGRVKVQFHWDRLGGRDDKSSCWIRVASTFAGGNYGAIFTPRIGHEVLVDFVEGDPDRPIITGSVYNADNMPPYTLPDEKTKSTVKTISSIGGGGFNEIRFEDKKGEEQFFVHAEKNQDIRVKNNCFEWIGNNRHLIVKTDQFVHVEHNRNLTIDSDDKTKVKGERHLTVTGKEAKEVGDTLSLTVKGDVDEVFKANHSEEVTGDYYLDGKGVVIEATQGITLKCGSNCVVIDTTGVTVKGNVLTLDGTSTVINSGPGSPAGSGKAASAVPPAAPDEAMEADVADPGTAAKLKEQQIQQKKGKYGATPLESHKPPETQEEKEQKKSWVEVSLKDQEGEPVPGERYQIKLPDGSVAEGTLNKEGFARVKGIDPGSCEITFPDVDRSAWEPK